MTRAVHPKYTYLKGNVYYFNRYIPSDLTPYYNTKRLVVSLRTSDKRYAGLRARNMSNELDKTWLSIRIKNDISIFDNRLNVDNRIISNSDTLSEALERYISLKGVGKSKTFAQSTTRAISSFISFIGDIPIDSFTSADVSKFREVLLKSKLKTASIKRLLSCIRAVMNFNIQELGLNHKNPFNNIYLPENNDATKRIPIKPKDIKSIQEKCFHLDDDIRHLIAMISDTGMRLAEAAGLLITDINLEATCPFVIVQTHPHRRLKTLTSERKIPLVGASLWAAQRAIKEQSSEYCFPRYNKQTTTNSNSASAFLNKWLKMNTTENYVIHSFRHAIRDRLRAVEAPMDMIDMLGGWSTSAIGVKYGNGFTLEHTKRYLEKITF